MATATLAPSPTESDVTERARLLCLLDSLAALAPLSTHATLSCAVFPCAAEVVELWAGANEGGWFLDRYATAWGECIALCQRKTCVAIVHVYANEIGGVQ